MPLTLAQKAQAEQRQCAAASDPAPQVRLVAGPGTGKSSTIEKRVVRLLSNGVAPLNVSVISFTRATCAELLARIQRFRANLPCAGGASQVRVSTMHSLALRILRRAHLLTSYPSTPILLDDWEQTNVYDIELASSLGCAPGRDKEIRLAYDAQWKTLNPQHVNQAQITPAEVQGALLPSQLPAIQHLIVEEFQDLNACDQEFVGLLSLNGAVLFVAGDDDQSIYSFLHANPDGIVQFPQVYQGSSTHVLSDCFRCAPGILDGATRLIAYNPSRVQKNLVSLYAAASPPAQSSLLVWFFHSAQEEARAIARSCRELINAGMAGREDEILILISNRRVQFGLIAQELGNLGLPYAPPRGKSLVDELEPIRAVYALLRVARDQTTGEEDYPAYRDILGVLSRVGHATAKAVADACITNNQNFRQLFHLPTCPWWLTGRPTSAVQRVMAIVQAVANWTMADTLGSRTADIAGVLSGCIFTSGGSAANNVNAGNTLAGALTPQMTLDELLQFLAADTESDQQAILDLVNQRIGGSVPLAQTTAQKKIRILTIAWRQGPQRKGGLFPFRRAGHHTQLQGAPGNGASHRAEAPVFVSVTRAMACCIIWHAAQHTGRQATTLTQQRVTRLTRSQFLNEMGVRSVTRAVGLSPSEARAIVAEVNKL